MTGAEKPRASDGTGRAGTSVKTNRCSDFVTESTCVVVRLARSALPSPTVHDASVPSGATRPTANGMWNGAFSGCPGVGGQDWRTFNVYRFALASYESL